MKTVKVVGLVAGLVIVAFVLVRVVVFAGRVADVFMETLQVGLRTAEHNERIAANLADARLGDRLATLTTSLESALTETTATIQALRPAIAETTAATRAARAAIVESAATAKAARTALEGAKLPDLDGVLRRADTLLERTDVLLQHADASAPPLLAASQRLVDRVDGVVSGADLTETLKTTGRLLANIERDQGNVSTLIANAVPVSETVKNEAKFVEEDLARLRQKASRARRFFGFLFGWL